MQSSFGHKALSARHSSHILALSLTVRPNVIHFKISQIEKGYKFIFSVEFVEHALELDYGSVVMPT
jgi:hypothetical protein